jgi:hypothetical protein
VKYQVESEFVFGEQADRDSLKNYLLGKSDFSEVGDELHISNDLDGTYKINHKVTFADKSVRDSVYDYISNKSSKARQDKPALIQRQDTRADEKGVLGETVTDVRILEWGDDVVAK